jgi:hypothetical protein
MPVGIQPRPAQSQLQCRPADAASQALAIVGHHGRHRRERAYNTTSENRATARQRETRGFQERLGCLNAKHLYPFWSPTPTIRLVITNLLVVVPPRFVCIYTSNSKQTAGGEGLSQRYIQLLTPFTSTTQLQAERLSRHGDRLELRNALAGNGEPTKVSPGRLTMPSVPHVADACTSWHDHNSQFDHPRQPDPGPMW